MRYAETVRRLGRRVFGAAGSFGRQVALVFSGSVAGQAVAFLASLALTRLYSPEDYGIMAAYAAVLGLVGLLGTMNYELAIPIASDRQEAHRITVVGLVCLLLSVLVLLFAGIFGAAAWLVALEADALARFWYVVPFGLLATGIFGLLSQWAIRARDYKAIAWASFSQTGSQAILGVSFGLLGLGAGGLLASRVLGLCGGAGRLYQTYAVQTREVSKRVPLKLLLATARRYSRFALFTSPRRYLGDLSMVLPVIFLGWLYDAAQVGFYGLANSVVQVPMTLIGTAVGSVYLGEAAKLRDSDRSSLLTLSNRLVVKLGLLGLGITASLIVFGPFVFGVVFGNAWSAAGSFAAILSISAGGRLVFKPISNLFDIYERQWTILWVTLVRVVGICLVFLAARELELPVDQALLLYSVYNAAIYLVQYLLARKLLVAIPPRPR